MRREAHLLRDKAVSSLILSIEHFNRPWDRGRVDGVLILLDHAFEMLLKSAILHRGGGIRRPREKQTIGFDACVRKALTEEGIRFLKREQALQLQTINSLRDAAQHHLVDLSEQHLYLHAQAGLTLFKDILKTVFAEDLRMHLPTRVLPISTVPPVDLATLFDTEVQEIRQLLAPGRRRQLEATAKLRGLAIFESAIQGEKLQPAPTDLRRLGNDIRQGLKWEQVFPGVASVNLTATGTGPSLDLRFSKKAGIPIRVVPEGTPGAIVAIKRVNELGFYNLGRNQLARKLNLSGPKTSALIQRLKLRGNADYHRRFEFGKSAFDRYSQKALDRLREELRKVTIDQVWEEYKRQRARRRSHG